MQLDRIMRMAAVCVAGFIGVAQCALITATGSGNWTDPIWDDPAGPQAGNDVLIPSGFTVTMDVPTPALNNFTVNGTIAHPANTAASAPWTVDGKIDITSVQFVLGSTGQINAQHLGYAGGDPQQDGKGPGGGAGTTGNGGGGGAHGGAGGDGAWGGAGGSPYDTPSDPQFPGSGGGGGGANAGDAGGNAGGLVRIQAGSVILDGTIHATGAAGINAGGGGGGGGSGGAILIDTATLQGSGSIIATGGDGVGWGGGGGGGIVALLVDSAAQSALPAPDLTVSVGGGGRMYAQPGLGQPGIVYANDPTVLPQVWTSDAVLAGFSSWDPSQLEIQGANLNLQNGASLNVGGDLSLLNGGLTLDGGSLNTAGNLSLNGSTLTALRGSGATPTMAVGGNLQMDAGLLHVFAENGEIRDLLVGGELSLASDSWIRPFSDGATGGVLKITTGDLTVSADSGINAVGTGFAGGVSDGAGYGPGAGGGGQYGGGAGYGGAGASAPWGGGDGGPAYGVETAPTEPGSGGGAGLAGGDGGGLIWIDATGGTMVIDGDLLASGLAGQPASGSGSGGGSGGGIFLLARTLSGTGELNVDGGAGGEWGGGGGGGIISVVTIDMGGWLGDISYAGAHGGGYTNAIGADGIYTLQIIPEPTTALLLCLGAMLTLGRFGRNRPRTA